MSKFKKFMLEAANSDKALIGKIYKKAVKIQRDISDGNLSGSIGSGTLDGVPSTAISGTSGYLDPTALSPREIGALINMGVLIQNGSTFSINTYELQQLQQQYNNTSNGFNYENPFFSGGPEGAKYRRKAIGKAMVNVPTRIIGQAAGAVLPKSTQVQHWQNTIN